MRTLCLFSIMIITSFVGTASPQHESILKNELIFDFQVNHVHSSTLVELPNGDILAAWFQLTDQGRERTSKNVKIMGARLKKSQQTWSVPFLMAETPFFPDGNPVLFLNGQKKLFLAWHVLQANVWHAAILKIRTSIDYSNEGAPIWEWQDNIILKPGEAFAQEVDRKLGKASNLSHAEQDAHIRTTSHDTLLRGIGWMTRLQPIILQHGPHKGRILLPLYNESQMMSLCAISDDDGATWTPGLPIVGRGNIQPALLEKKNGDIVAYMRDAGGKDYRIQTSHSTDSGYTWSPTTPMKIHNPGSSVEAKVLADGRWVMICNDRTNFKKLGTGCCDGRQQLSLYISENEGDTWEKKIVLVDDTGKPQILEKRGRFHYPSLIQTQDGVVHITYTHNIRETPYKDGNDNAIKHIAIDPKKL